MHYLIPLQTSMNAVKELMVVLKTVIILEDHIHVVVTMVIVLTAMDSPVMVRFHH